MHQILSPVSAPQTEASLSGGDLHACQIAEPVPAILCDLVHDLRQPLSVIETLAYYLELMSTDEKISAHLRKIQAMVFEANRILEQTNSAFC